MLFNMNYKDLNKDSYLIKVFSDSPTPLYYVEDKIYDGIRIIKVARNPLSARVYTITEAFKELFESLSEKDKEELHQAYLKKERFGDSLSNRLFKTFRVLKIDNVNCWNIYEDEEILLKELDLEYMIKDLNPKVQVVGEGENK